MEVARSHSDNSHTAEQSGELLVLIEPDDDVRDALQVLLKGQGWQVCFAADLKDLQQNLDQLAACAVVSEVRLPGCRAVDVLRYCQERSVPVVFTGHDVAVQEAVDLIRQGAVDYLEKPFSRQRLLNLLNRLANRHNGRAIPG